MQLSEFRRKEGSIQRVDVTAIDDVNSIGDQDEPIVNNQRLIDEQPDYVVLLAWHYAEPIVQQLRSRGLKSKFVLPLPNVKILD